MSISLLSLQLDPTLPVEHNECTGHRQSQGLSTPSAEPTRPVHHRDPLAMRANAGPTSRPPRRGPTSMSDVEAPRKCLGQLQVAGRLANRAQARAGQGPAEPPPPRSLLI